MKCLVVLVFLIITSVKNSYGEERAYTIGYINHPRIHTYYKPLIEEAYRRIGITPTFIEVGGERGLRLLNDGFLDADIIRFESVTRPFSNVLPIYPPLANGRVSLYCASDVPCNLGILRDPSLTIAVRRRFKAQRRENKDIPDIYANLDGFEDIQKIRDLMTFKRYSYAILPSDGSSDADFEAMGITTIAISTEQPAVHVIHKRNLHLSGALFEALQTVIEERG